jgi:hypothetical protein
MTWPVTAGWLAGCPSTSEPFAFKGPSNILQRVLNSLILQRDPLSFKGRKSAILTLLTFPYPSKGSLILQRVKKCNFDPFDLPLSLKGIPYPSKGEKVKF